MPAGSAADVLPRSLVACVAAIIEVDPDTLPPPFARADGISTGSGAADAEADLWRQLGEALATRGIGVVPVMDPAGFSWGGWWIARLIGPGSQPGGVPAGAYVVMSGTPSDVVFDPAGVSTAVSSTGERGGVVAQGWVLTRPMLDLIPTRSDPQRTAGVVEQLFRAGGPAGTPEELASAEVTVAGIVGDRYAVGQGHFSVGGRGGEAVTLIQAESLEFLTREHEITLPPGAHRRNVVTRGIDVHSVLGQRFWVGEVECYGQRVAEPCAWLQTLTPPGTLRGLVHRGGIRADVLTPGTVHLGDTVCKSFDLTS